MRDTAYLVGFINKKTGTVDYAGCFSEENPTTDLRKYHPVVLLKGYGKDYQDGQQGLGQTLRLKFEGGEGPYTWMIRLLSDTTKHHLGIV